MGGDPKREISRTITQALSLVASNAGTPSTALDLTDIFYCNVATQLSTTTGGVSAMSGKFEYSIDNTNWTQLVASTNSNVNAPQQTTLGVIARYIRFNMASITFSGGATTLNSSINVARSYN